MTEHLNEEKYEGEDNSDGAWLDLSFDEQEIPMEEVAPVGGNVLVE